MTTLARMDALRVRLPGGAYALGGNQHWFEVGGGGACSTTTAANILAYLMRTRPEWGALYDAAAAAGGAGAVPGASFAGAGESADATSDVGIQGDGAGGLDGAAAVPPLSEKAGMLRLMEAVREHVHPTHREFGCMQGSFAAGLGRVAGRFALPLRTRTLDMPKYAPSRPSIGDVRAFIGDALAEGTPVAFLNLGLGIVFYTAFFGKGVPIAKCDLVGDPENPPYALDDWHWVTVVGIADALPGTDDVRICPRAAHGAGHPEPAAHTATGASTPEPAARTVGSDPPPEASASAAGSAPLYVRILDNNDLYWVDLAPWLRSRANTGALVGVDC